MKKEFILNTSWSYFCLFGAMVFGYLNKIQFTGAFSNERVGLLFSVIGTLEFMYLITNFGMYRGFYFYGIQFYEQKEFSKLKLILFFNFAVQIVIGLSIVVLVCFFLQPVSKYYFKTNDVLLLLYFLPFFLINNICKLLEIFFIVSRTYVMVNVHSLTLNGLTFILTFFFLKNHFNQSKIGIVFTASSFIILNLYAFIAIRKYGYILKQKMLKEWQVVRDTIKYGLRSFLGECLGLIIQRTDLITITIYIGLTAVAYFEIALSTATLLSLFLNPAIAMMSPYITRYIYYKDWGSLNLMIEEGYKFIILLGLPITICFCFYSQEIILLIFGERFLPSIPSLRVLSFLILLQHFHAINYSVFAGFGYLNYINKIYLYGSITNIVLNLFLANIFGIIGVAVTTVSVYTIMLFMSIRLLKKKSIDITISVFFLLKLLLALSVFLAILYFCNKNIHIPTNYSLFNKPLSVMFDVAISCSISMLFFVGITVYLKIFDWRFYLNFFKKNKISQ